MSRLKLSEVCVYTTAQSTVGGSLYSDGVTTGQSKGSPNNRKHLSMSLSTVCPALLSVFTDLPTRSRLGHGGPP